MSGLSEDMRSMRWTTFATVIFPKSWTKWVAAAEMTEELIRRAEGITTRVKCFSTASTCVLHIGQRLSWLNERRMQFPWNVCPHSRTKRPFSHVMSSQQMQQYPKSAFTLFDFDFGDSKLSDDNKQWHFDAAFGAIGGTGTVGTFGVVRGNAVTAPGLLVVTFCCLFEERVIAGSERCWTWTNWM